MHGLIGKTPLEKSFPRRPLHPKSAPTFLDRRNKKGRCGTRRASNLPHRPTLRRGIARGAKSPATRLPSNPAETSVRAHDPHDRPGRTNNSVDCSERQAFLGGASDAADFQVVFVADTCRCGPAPPPHREQPCQQAECGQRQRTRTLPNDGDAGRKTSMGRSTAARQPARFKNFRNANREMDVTMEKLRWRHGESGGVRCTRKGADMPASAPRKEGRARKRWGVHTRRPTRRRGSAKECRTGQLVFRANRHRDVRASASLSRPSRLAPTFQPGPGPRQARARAADAKPGNPAEKPAGHPEAAVGIARAPH